MNTIKKTIFLFAIMFFGISGLKAQFNLSGEFIPRTELSHGYKTLAHADQVASLFTSQRTRVNFGYKSDRLTSKFVLQDVRNWGGQKQLAGNEDFAASVHEAWAQAKLHYGISLRVGRQELGYDNSRIFGNVGWAQQGRSHDLLLLKYEENFNLHVGVAYNQSGVRTNNFYFGPDAYKAMQFVWFNKSFGRLNVSLLALNNGVPYTISTGDAGEITEQGIRYSQTMGTYLAYKAGKLSFGGNVYYQMGKDPSGKELSAYEVLVEAGYAFSAKSKIGLSYEKLSGTNTSGATVNNSFTPLYGTNHKFNGHMDYFFVGNHINSVGLQDVTFSISQKVHKHTINAHVHAFMSSVALTSGNYLGTELDLFLVHPIGDNIKIQLGYSQMFAGDDMADIKTGSVDATSNWAYVMFVFTPKYIK